VGAGGGVAQRLSSTLMGRPSLVTITCSADAGHVAAASAISAARHSILCGHIPNGSDTLPVALPYPEIDLVPKCILFKPVTLNERISRHLAGVVSRPAET
jgi:hypothetical protein